MIKTAISKPFGLNLETAEPSASLQASASVKIVLEAANVSCSGTSLQIAASDNFLALFNSR